MDTGVFGANNDDAIENLEADMKTYYQNTNEPYRLRGKLVMNRIKTSGDWPKLKAKAAPCRHIGKYCKHLCELDNSGSLHDRRRLAVVTLLQRFYDILEVEDRFVSESAKHNLATLVQ
jgi:hypothetical protein